MARNGGSAREMVRAGAELPHLPFEIQRDIIMNVPLSDAVDKSKVVSIMPGADYDSLKSERANYGRVFEELTPRVCELMHVMTYTNTFLGGPRAAGFFFPGLCPESSSWDFFCCGGMLQRRAFLAFMRSIGSTVADSEEDRFYAEMEAASFGLPCNAMLNCTLRNKGTTHGVRIMSSISRTEVETALRLSCTTVRCYISGIEAVCIDERLTNSGRMYPRSAYSTYYGDSNMPEGAGQGSGMRMMTSEEYKGHIGTVSAPRSIQKGDCMRVQSSVAPLDNLQAVVEEHRLDCAAAVSWEDRVDRIAITRKGEHDGMVVTDFGGRRATRALVDYIAYGLYHILKRYDRFSRVRCAEDGVEGQRSPMGRMGMVTTGEIPEHTARVFVHNADLPCEDNYSIY